MPAPRKETKWWIASVVLPFIGLGVGLLLAVTAPRKEYDLIGAAVFMPIFLGLVAGCILSAAVATVSVLKREARRIYAVLVGLPALAFVILSGYVIVEGLRQSKVDEAVRIESRKAEVAKQLFRARCREELRANPALITDEKFWKEHQRPDKAYEIGLLNLLADPTFEPTPEIVEYVMKHVTYATDGLFANDRLSRAQLEIIAEVLYYPENSRSTAASMIRAEKYKIEPNSEGSKRQ